MKEFYDTEIFEETGAEYTIKLTLLKDRATITVDTSGPGLHKRGYRVKDVAAPIKETLAAALVQLFFWNPERILVDTCCGSGTIPIEAAMIGRNIAPGLNRKFASDEWEFIGKGCVARGKKGCFLKKIDYERELNIYGFDINGRAVSAARENAEEAGVDDCIAFKRADVADMKAAGRNGIIITNSAIRREDRRKKEIEKIFTELFVHIFKIIRTGPCLS